MPRAAAHPCAWPGCRELVDRGVRYCVAHRKARYRAIDAKRGSTAQRGYDSAWQRLRVRFLAAHPLCQCDDCDDGRKHTTAASVVDHRIPISERPDLRLEWSNLRSMAKACHDRHTARAQGFARGGGQKSGSGAV